MVSVFHIILDIQVSYQLDYLLSIVHPYYILYSRLNN